MRQENLGLRQSRAFFLIYPFVAGAVGNFPEISASQPLARVTKPPNPQGAELADRWQSLINDDRGPCSIIATPLPTI
jgi:hypothetical protein